MRRLAFHVLLVTAAAAATAHAQHVPDRGVFMISSDTQTIIVERFERRGDTLRSNMTTVGHGRMAYTALLTPALGVKTLIIDVFNAAIDTIPSQHAFFEFATDSVAVDVGGHVQKLSITHDAVPLINNTLALAELLTERAKRNPGPLDVSVWAPAGGVSLVVHLSPIGRDSLLFSVAGSDERFKVNAEGRILGGMVVGRHVVFRRMADASNEPLVTPLLAPGHSGAAVARPDYSVPAGAPYRAIEVTVPGQHGITLAGTLTVPMAGRAPFPAVVTITGSGQQDRDETIPFAGGIKIFRQVADTLGRRGIAVLRLDDRMVGGSSGPLGTTADYADDVRGAIAFLRARPEVDPRRIGLIGHSEGGEIAPMVAATDSGLVGIVLLAGPGRPGRAIVMDQNRQGVAAAPGLSAQQRDSLMSTVPAALDSVGRSNAWYGFFLQYDPIPTARRVHVPVLIMQGLTDHQVSPDQADSLAIAFRAGGNRDVTVRIFPNVDHLFVPDSSGAFTGYSRLTNNKVPNAVLGTVADWFTVHFATRK